MCVCVCVLREREGGRAIDICNAFANEKRIGMYVGFLPGPGL